MHRSSIDRGMLVESVGSTHWLTCRFEKWVPFHTCLQEHEKFILEVQRPSVVSSACQFTLPSLHEAFVLQGDSHSARTSLDAKEALYCDVPVHALACEQENRLNRSLSCARPHQKFNLSLLGF
eukprot:1474904-Amphidinium_carterae.1